MSTHAERKIYRDELKQYTKEKYDKIKKVYCFCLKEYVIFNSKGFHHLLYDTQGRARTINEQIYRLNLFPLVIPVIKKTKKIASYKLNKKNIGDWTLIEKVGKNNDVKIKVILRKRGNGNITFCSVMKMR